VWWHRHDSSHCEWHCRFRSPQDCFQLSLHLIEHYSSLVVIVVVSRVSLALSPAAAERFMRSLLCNARFRTETRSRVTVTCTLQIVLLRATVDEPDPFLLLPLY
jgi:hypothetical protein